MKMGSGTEPSLSMRVLGKEPGKRAALLGIVKDVKVRLSKSHLIL